LNTFSHHQLEQSCDFYQCPAAHWLKLVGGVFIFPYEAAGPLNLCLDSADNSTDWPCADHMHSPKNKKKKTL
ncbi:unnamed protein product, partial [Staurois parvus]